MPIPTPQWDELPEKNNSCPNVVQNHHHAMSHKCTVYLKNTCGNVSKKIVKPGRVPDALYIFGNHKQHDDFLAMSHIIRGFRRRGGHGWPHVQLSPFCDDEQNFFVLRYNLNLLQVRHTIIHGITHFLVGPSTPRPDRRSCLPPGHVWN